MLRFSSSYWARHSSRRAIASSVCCCWIRLRAWSCFSLRLPHLSMPCKSERRKSFVLAFTLGLASSSSIRSIRCGNAQLSIKFLYYYYNKYIVVCQEVFSFSISLTISRYFLYDLWRPNLLNHRSSATLGSPCQQASTITPNSPCLAPQ